MQSLDAYSGYGKGMAGEMSQAAGGMRGLRDDLWRRMFDLRNRQMNNQMQDQKKNRQMMMMSAGLGAAGSMAPGLFGGGGPPNPMSGRMASTEMASTMAPMGFMAGPRNFGR